MPENLPESLLQIKLQAEKFVEETIRPLQSQVKGKSIVPKAIKDEVRAASMDTGFFFKTQPEEFGGNPASSLELTMLRELWAATNSELTDSIFGPGPGLLHSATGSLRENYLLPVMAGSKKGAFGFTEPDDAVRPSWAQIDGDKLIINGQKSYVTGGATADFVSILVNVEQTDGTKVGTAMVVVDREAPGVHIDDEFTSMEGGGHVSMTFEAVAVPLTNVIGELGEGMPRALRNIGNVRLMVSAQATGLCMWAIDYVQQHLLAPHRSGTPLGQREGVRLRYADMRIQTYAARSALYRTARIVDSGENSVNETIATKVFCTETAGRIIDMAVQLVGGQALVVGHPLEKMYRQVRSLRLVEGANDLLRINLVKGNLELNKGRL